MVQPSIEEFYEKKTTAFKRRQNDPTTYISTGNQLKIEVKSANDIDIRNTQNNVKSNSNHFGSFFNSNKKSEC